MIRLTSEEYKNRLISILVKIDKLCRENDIRYTIIYGTLLGAVRHKGFIPWDDDVDMAMTREDYYRLRKCIEDHPELDLNFIDADNQKDTIYICGKVCDKKTVVKESIFKTVEGYGAFVDVFPLDNLPDNETERDKFKSHARHMAKIVQHSAQLNPGKPKGIKHAILLYLSFLYSHCFSTHKTIERLNKHCVKYNDVETEHFGVPYFISYFKKADFDELIDLPFEGHMFKGPKNYESVLNASYVDYKQLPPPEKRKSHSVECYWKE